MPAPAAMSTIPNTSMSLLSGPWRPTEPTQSSTVPHRLTARPTARISAGSALPPLFSCSIRCRLCTQFMSWIAELRSCLSNTARARRQRVVPTPRRHSPDRLVVVDSRPTPPSPNPTMRATEAQYCISVWISGMAGSHSMNPKPDGAEIFTFTKISPTHSDPHSLQLPPVICHHSASSG
uniref:Uncharacterized protein n=1 Tax=Nothobranchius furzeri TaxID=105023 RepID=A0A8C6LV56_NOTFU